MPNCKPFTVKRQQCHYLYGKLGEDCLVQELAEKRCLAFSHCSRQAQAYYSSLEGKKGLCGSWAEAFCFANPMIELDEAVVELHRKAREMVNENKKLRADCRTIALDLSKCLAKRNLLSY